MDTDMCRWATLELYREWLRNKRGIYFSSNRTLKDPRLLWSLTLGFKDRRWEVDFECRILDTCYSHVAKWQQLYRVFKRPLFYPSTIFLLSIHSPCKEIKR